MTQATGETAAPRYSLAERLKQRWRWEKYRFREYLGDRALAIETLWDRPKGALNPLDRNQPYEAISYEGLKIVRDHARPGAADRFFDVGCGAGRALCFFARQPLQACIGIEYDEALSARALRNAAAMKGRKAPIDVQTISAERADYSGCTIAFLYNSFGADVMRGFLHKLRADAGESLTMLIYANPVHARVIENHAWLRRGAVFQIPHLCGPVNALVYHGAA